MKMQHWIVLLVLLFFAYLAGVKFPGPGQSALGTVGLS
jgi:hypothetical protein